MLWPGGWQLTMSAVECESAGVLQTAEGEFNSGTPLIRTPMGQKKVPSLVRWPLFM